MHRRLFAALAALALLPATSACAAPGQTAQIPAKLQWRIAARDNAADGKINFELSYRTANSRSSWGRTMDVADLQGLDPASLKTGSTVVRFRIVRDAGDFDCEGTVWHGSGTGECSFAPGRAFAADLARDGYGTPDDVQLFHLAMAEIGRAYIAEVARQGYARPDIAQLIDAGDHGVQLSYLTGMGALGYHVGTLPALVAMRDHGISADYVEAMASNGFQGIALDQLLELRDHGVTADYVAAMRTAGYAAFTPADLLRLRDNGISADDARRAGTGHSADDLIRLRNGG